MSVLRVFINLIRLGLLTKDVSESDYNALKKINKDQWIELYNMALDHRVAAIVYDGIQRVFHAYGDPFETIEDSKLILRKWIAIVDQIEKRIKFR